MEARKKECADKRDGEFGEANRREWLPVPGRNMEGTCMCSPPCYLQAPTTLFACMHAARKRLPIVWDPDATAATSPSPRGTAPVVEKPRPRVKGPGPGPKLSQPTQQPPQQPALQPALQPSPQRARPSSPDSVSLQSPRSDLHLEAPAPRPPPGGGDAIVAEVIAATAAIAGPSPSAAVDAAMLQQLVATALRPGLNLRIQRCVQCATVLGGRGGRG
jgi:hypothetical protein